jgi:hypothetical protein
VVTDTAAPERTADILTPSNLAISEGIVKRWIEQEGQRGFAVSPDYLLALIQFARASSDTRKA